MARRGLLTAEEASEMIFADFFQSQDEDYVLEDLVGEIPEPFEEDISESSKEDDEEETSFHVLLPPVEPGRTDVAASRIAPSVTQTLLSQDSPQAMSIQDTEYHDSSSTTRGFDLLQPVMEPGSTDTASHQIAMSVTQTPSTEDISAAQATSVQDPVSHDQPSRSRGRPRSTGRRVSAEDMTQIYADWENVIENDTNGPECTHRFRETKPGPNEIPETAKTPKDYFKLFFTNELAQDIVQETNRYAEEKIASTELPPFSRLRKWKPLTVDEFFIIIGVMLNMTLSKQPGIADYWMKKSNRHHAWFANIISRDRFQLVFHTMLHLCDLDAQRGRFRGDKIQSIVDKLVNTFQKYFRPFQNVAADETMVAYKGRVIFRQYIPKKPHKWGILIRTLADSVTGYMLNMKVYYGKDEGGEQVEGLTKTSTAVVDLMKPYLRKGYHVFCDRLYSSLSLAHYLHKNGTYFTGTINLNRKGVPAEMKKKMKKGEKKALRSGKILLHNWTDKRTVSMISTLYRGDQMVTKSKEIRGREITIEKPKVVEEYNKYMGGVDLSDQITSYYQFARKSVKWWKKIFFWLVEVSVSNSYILYKLDQRDKQPSERLRKISMLAFRDSLVNELAPMSEGTSRKRGRPSNEPSPIQDCFHVQKRLETGAKECKYCSTRSRNEGGKRKNSIYFCQTCPSQPGLHPGDCFSNYHLDRLYGPSIPESSTPGQSAEPVE